MAVLAKIVYHEWHEPAITVKCIGTLRTSAAYTVKSILAQSKSLRLLGPRIKRQKHNFA